MRAYNLDGYEESRSEHYIYYYKPYSLAEKDLDKIKQIQEESYSKIVGMLGVKPDFLLRYVLCDSSDEVGRAYGDYEPCNGFADSPDTVFAVYSDKVKCIGPHEDTHLIAELIARPSSAFVREGLAMYMDETWWGRTNAVWVKEFITTGRYVSIGNLFDNQGFWEWPDEITYPIAGAFTLWLIQMLGIKAYLKRVYVNGEHALEAIENALSMPFEQAEQLFCEWIQAFAE